MSAVISDNLNSSVNVFGDGLAAADFFTVEVLPWPDWFVTSSSSS